MTTYERATPAQISYLQTLAARRGADRQADYQTQVMVTKRVRKGISKADASVLIDDLKARQS